MKINFKKNGGGYISGCTISFGSKEMKDLKIIDSTGKLKEIVSAKNKDENTLIIKLKESKEGVSMYEHNSKSPKDLITEQELSELEGLTEGQLADYIAENEI